MDQTAGGTGFVGTTLISAKSNSTFNVDAVKLKICFQTVGEVPEALSLATDAFRIYNADVGGMPSYTSLTSAMISTELVGLNQFCFVVDFGSVAAAEGVVVGGSGKINCNWVFTPSKVTGLTLDSRVGSEPQLTVLYKDAAAACLSLK